MGWLALRFGLAAEDKPTEFHVLVGLDWGGVSREFFERLCVELFDSSNLLFRRFNEENHQALVSCTLSCYILLYVGTSNYLTTLYRIL